MSSFSKIIRSCSVRKEHTANRFESMRPWAESHHRGGLLGGAAFPLRLTRLFSAYLNEFLEPVMSFFLDIMTALILGFFFVIQSISVLLSLDSIVVAMIKYIQGILYSILSYTFAIFTLDDSDKRIIGYSLIDFATNLLWAAMVSPASISGHVKEIFFIMPCVAFATVHCLSSVLANKVELHPENIMYAPLLTTVLCGQTLMFIAILSKNVPLYIFPFQSQAPDKIAMFNKSKDDIFGLFFILKANIDIFFHAAGTLCKYFARDHQNNLANSHNHTTASLSWLVESQDPLDIPQYLESSRQTLWLMLTFHQFFALRQSLRRQDLWFFYCVLFHLFAKLITQFRAISKRLQVKRTIAKRFYRITNQELLRLQAEGERCAICLNEHNIRESMRIPCQHVFHVACLTRVLQATPRGQASRCPICRADIHTHTRANINNSTTINFNPNDNNSTANSGTSLNNLRNNLSFLSVRIVRNTDSTIPPLQNSRVASTLAEALERSRINVNSSSVGHNNNHSSINATTMNITAINSIHNNVNNSSSSSDINRVLARNADGQSFSIDRSAMVAAIREHYQQQRQQQQDSVPSVVSNAQNDESEEEQEHEEAMNEDDIVDEDSEDSGDDHDNVILSEEESEDDVWVTDNNEEKIDNKISNRNQNAKKENAKIDTALMVLDEDEGKENAQVSAHEIIEEDGDDNLFLTRRGTKRMFDIMDAPSSSSSSVLSQDKDISSSVTPVHSKDATIASPQPSLDDNLENKEADKPDVKRQRR